LDLHRILKYAIDRVAAWVLLVVLSPVLAAIAIAIRLDSAGSPFFLQERAGAGGYPFTIFKFRTMRQGSEHQGLGHTTAKHDDRITRVGAFLRATSLDELPQVINIALGEMSFIGPRPTLRYQVEKYTARQRRRLLFRPGITGWAQVHGRNEISWERRIDLDLEYVDRYSLWLDVRILCRTVGVLSAGGGVYAAGGANDDFTGGAAASPEPAATVASAAAEPPVSPVVTQVASAAPAPTVTPAPSAAPALAAPQLPLLVIGAGGHARVLIDIAEKQGRYRVVGLLDDRTQLHGTQIMGYPVLGGRELLGQPNLPSHAVVAIGSPQPRAAWQAHLEEHGFQLAVLVHPAAQIGREVQIGAGTVLMAGVAVNSGTRLGRGVIVNTAASIDHDCEIGDFVHVAPGARLAGGVRVGERSHIGIGSCVIQYLQVGADATVGAGAAVIRNVAAQSTVVGVPARALPARHPAAPVTATA